MAELHDAGADLPDLERIVLLQGSSPNATSWSDFLADGDQVSTSQLDERVASGSSDDVCDVLFTSGTTGRPKGVMTTHEQNLRVFQTWCDTVGLRSGDRYLMVNPYFHAFGYKAGILASMLTGATMYPESVFDVVSVFERIESESISETACFPSGAPNPWRSHRSMSSSPTRHSMMIMR